MLFVPELVGLATAYVFEKDSLAEKQLRALLNYWAVNQVFGAEDMKVLRDQMDEGLLIAQGGTPVRKRSNYLPMYHGDKLAPWNDLPASYMLDQLVSHPRRPLNSRRFRIAKLNKKPVSPGVHRMLDRYLASLDRKLVPTGDRWTGEVKRSEMSQNDMGHLIACDQESNERKTTANSLGWSSEFSKDLRADGLPTSIKLAREVATLPPPQHRDYYGRRSTSCSSASSYNSNRNRRSKGRSGSNHGQSPPRNESQNSRNQNWNKSYRERSPPSLEGWSSRIGQGYDGKEGDQQHPLPRPYSNDSPGLGQQWHESNASGRTQGARGSDQHSPPKRNAAHGSSQPPQLPLTAAPFEQQNMLNQLPRQFPGQPPMNPLHGPPPFPVGAFPHGMPLPPPNYNGPFPPPPPNMMAMANSPYNFGANQFGGNNSGHGHNVGHTQGRGNYGGGRGYNNNNPRGGYRGQQRGQRGGW
jgi:hypothetical protein